MSDVCPDEKVHFLPVVGPERVSSLRPLALIRAMLAARCCPSSVMCNEALMVASILAREVVCVRWPIADHRLSLLGSERVLYCAREKQHVTDSMPSNNGRRTCFDCRQLCICCTVPCDGIWSHFAFRPQGLFLAFVSSDSIATT